MAHTVIGFFRNSADAVNASDELKREGFREGDIDVSLSYGSMNDHDFKEERSGRAANFFNSLPDINEDDAAKFSNASNENSFVSVSVNSIEEAERVAGILNRHGALDVSQPSGEAIIQDNQHGSDLSTDGSRAGKGRKGPAPSRTV